MKLPNKNNGFKIPENYLENFDDALLSRIAFEEESKLPNKDGFAVPDGYFNTLHKNITDKLEEPTAKVIPLKSYKKYYYAAMAAAALLVLFIGINLNKTESYSIDDLANADIDAYIEYTDLDLSTYEIAEVVPVDNLDLADILEIGLNEENVLDYLDENVDNFNELNLDDYDY